MINTAMIVADWMYRGSSFKLPISILDEDGNPSIIEEEETAHLRVFYDEIDPTVLIEKEAALVYGDIGLVIFEIEPSDTIDLLEQSYVIKVHIQKDEEVFPVLVTRLGVVPFNPVIMEEEE